MFDITKIGNVLDRVKTPLTLGGLVLLVLYGIYSQILKLGIFPQLPAASAFTLLQAIVRYLFWLAIVAIIFGVGSYLAIHFVTQLKPVDAESSVALKPIRRQRTKKGQSPANNSEL